MNDDNEPAVDSKLEAKASSEALLVEYAAAQSSAEHHDRLTWNIISIFWAASLVLFGFTLNHLGGITPILLNLLSCILGMTLVYFAWIFANQFRDIKNRKYKRCQNIEEILGMRQHRNEVNGPDSQQTNQKSGQGHEQGSQQSRLKAMTIIFCVVWGILFLYILF